MATIDSEAKGIVGELANGVSSRTLSETDRAKLAALATKLCFTYEFLNRDSLVLPSEARHQFRQTLKPLPGYEVQLAHYDGSMTKHLYAHRLMQRVSTDEQMNVLSTVPLGRKFTLVLAALVLQVWAPVGPISVPLSRDGRSVGVWPLVSGVVRWPPDIALNDATLGAYSL